MKKIWGADYEQLLRPVFLCFHGQKMNLDFFGKYCSIRTKKLHRVKVKKKGQKILGSIFYGGIKKFNVSTKTLENDQNFSTTK